MFAGNSLDRKDWWVYAAVVDHRGRLRTYSTYSGDYKVVDGELFAGNGISMGRVVVSSPSRFEFNVLLEEYKLLRDVHET